jgi:hypothetical protein
MHVAHRTGGMCGMLAILFLKTFLKSHYRRRPTSYRGMLQSILLLATA